MNDYDFQDQVPQPGEDKDFELAQLQAIADLVGDYEWQYTGKVANTEGTDTHSGPTAQQIESIPGYENCVEEIDGVKQVNVSYLALAMMGTLAALTRRIIKSDYIDEEEIKI